MKRGPWCGWYHARGGEGVELPEKGLAWPFQEGRNLSHQAISWWASRFMVIWWCGRRNEVERSIRRRRKMRPAGMIRQAKFSLPIKDRSSLLRHLLREDQDWSSDINSWSLSSGREVSMELVSIKIPRNTKRVVGPSSLLGARGMPPERPCKEWSWHCGHRRMSGLGWPWSSHQGSALSPEYDNCSSITTQRRQLPYLFD